MTVQTWRKVSLIVSFALFQFPLFHLFLSPVLSIAGAWQGVAVSSLIIYGVLAIVSLFLGRAFCGWACPAGALQESCIVLGARPIGNRRLFWLKYVIFGIWLAAVVLGVIQAGGFHRVDPMFGVIADNPLRSFLLRYGVLLTMVPLSFLAGKWASCHYICWIAPLMILGSRAKERIGWPSLRLEAVGDRCISCQECAQACPMSLDVSSRASASSMTDDECILCGSCIATCPSEALRFAYSRRSPVVRTS